MTLAQWTLMNIEAKEKAKNQEYKVAENECSHDSKKSTVLGNQCSQCGKVLKTWDEIYSQDEKGKEILKKLNKQGIYF